MKWIMMWIAVLLCGSMMAQAVPDSGNAFSGYNDIKLCNYKLLVNTDGSLVMGAERGGDDQGAIVMQTDSLFAPGWYSEVASLGNTTLIGMGKDAKGDIYVSGSSGGDPNEGNATAGFDNMRLYNSGLSLNWVGKLSAKGGWRWVKKMDYSDIFSFLYGSVTDKQGNTYLTGSFADTLWAGKNKVATNDRQEVFVAKIDSIGNWLWLRKGGSNWDDKGSKIVLDGKGGVYVLGEMGEAASFGTIKLPLKGSRDVFVAKMDTNGNWLWAKNMGNGYSFATDMAVDKAGNLYVSGQFDSLGIFGNTRLDHLMGDRFIAKLDGMGNFLRVSQYKVEYLQNLGTDAKNNLYFTGSMLDSLTIGDKTIYSLGARDGFVGKMDATGKIIWLQAMGGYGDDDVNGLTVNGNGKCYVSGNYEGQALLGLYATEYVGDDKNNDFIYALPASGPLNPENMPKRK